MVLGLFAIFVVYAVAVFLKLAALTTVLKALIFYLPFADHRALLARAAPGARGLRPHAVLRPLLRLPRRGDDLRDRARGDVARRPGASGALIVLERREGLKTYIENGVRDRLRGLLRAARDALRAGHAAPRRRRHRLGRPGRRRRVLPAALAQGGPPQALRHAPPRRHRHHRGDRRAGDRRLGGARHDLARPRRRAPGGPGRQVAARPPASASSRRTGSR